MNNSGHPIQPPRGQGNSSGGQPQNQFQAVQNNFQQQLQSFQNMAVNQPQQMGQMNWANQGQDINNGVNNIMQQQQNNGVQNQLNVNWQKQQQPSLGGQQGNQMLNMNANISSAPNNMMNSNITMSFQGMPQVPSGGVQNNANNNVPANLNQQQVQAQLFWNAFRASQGQVGNQVGQSLQNSGGNANVQMSSMQMMNNAQQGMMGNSAPPQAQSMPSVNNGGGSDGNFNGAQGFNPMNQLQAQMSSNQMQQQQHQQQIDGNARPPSSFSTSNSSNQNSAMQQQQQPIRIGNFNHLGNSNGNGSNIMNQDQGAQQGINFNQSIDQNTHQQLLLQQFQQNKQVDSNMANNIQGGAGIGNMQNYLKQLQAMQQMQQFAANANAIASAPNQMQFQVNTPASSMQLDLNQAQPGQMQQMMQGMLTQQENNASTNASQENLNQLLNPDPIVIGGKVHAASFPVMAVPGGNVLSDGQIEGELVNVQTQGIFVEGGNSGNGRFLAGNFAGGWQSNADLPERRKLMFSIIKLVESIRPDANRLSRDSRLPHMAKKLEEHLYRSAPTRDEYLDSSSLKRRLHLIAKGVGVPKPNSEDDNASPLLDRMGAPMDLQNVMLQQNSIQMNASAPQHMQQSNLLPPNNMQQAMQPLPTGSQGNAVLNPQQMQITPQILQQLQMQQLIQNQPTNNAPQSAQIPNAHSTNTDTPGSSRVDDAHAKKKVQVLQQQQRRLMLLRHSKLCNNPKCTTKFCPQMIVLWKHLKFCRGTTCPVPHCVSSRCVLSHHFNCKQKNISNTCEICFPVKQLAEKLGDTEDDWNDDWDNLVVEIEGGGEGESVMSNNATNTAASTMSNASDPLATMAGLLSQAQLQLSQSPPAPGDSQGLIEDIQKKHAVLAQIQSQKEALNGQNKLLLDQLSSSQSRENTSQLQNQFNLLQHFNAQFEQQETFLQGELNHQTQLLRQIGARSSTAPQTSSDPPKEKMAKRRKSKSKTPKQPEADDIASHRMPPLSSSISTTPSVNPTTTSKKRSASPKSDATDPHPTRNKSLKQDDTVFQRSEHDTTVAASEADDRPPLDSSPLDLTSILSSMSCADIEQHLDSLVSGYQLTPRCVTRKCLPLLRKLLRNEHGWVFKDPVDPVELGLDNYFDIIKNPMCLNKVEEELNNFAYTDIQSFQSAVQLVFDNAILFNGEDSDIGKWARELLDTFNDDAKNLIKGLGIVSKEDTIAACKDDAVCSLCGSAQLLFEPPSLFCSGSLCGMSKIRRNVFYYTDHSKQNHWCDRCYNDLKEETAIQLDDGKETKKSHLLRLKNDAMPEEQWVQCDDCNEWNHQVCALFNATRRNSSKTFSCPKCVLAKSKGDQFAKKDSPVSTYKDASALPECKMSRAIEEGLSQALSEEYERLANERGCNLAEVEKADGLCVRVVMSLEKKHKVREGMLSRYSSKGFPSEFPVTSKCILLFQKIHGVDVLLFGMYVYEYGDTCPAPNRRRVYISYLDSVHYLQPMTHRTFTYHTIICEYLRFVKMRGFHTAHIWSCPPSKGDEYIFYCHPTQQLTPKDEMLRHWYVEALNRAQEKGVVLQTKTIYDEYFKDNGTNPETGEPFDPTSLPYFDGDYIPGEIEKIINIISKDESLREGSKDANSKSNSKGQKKEGKRKGTRSNPGELVNQDRDKVMNRLDLALARMKSNFFVAQLLSDDFIKCVDRGVNVSSWVDDLQSNPLMKPSKQIGKNPDLLEHEGTSPGVQKLPPTLSSQVIGDTTDEDPSMEQECLDTRIAFLNFCQKKYMQFDELRRAKYSTMLLLSELHDPRAEKEHLFSVHLQVIAHATSCSGCESKNCRLMKQLFGHVRKCEVTYRNGCKVCCRLFMLLTKHARDCDAETGTCDIPFCERIRERQRRILKQQQVLDDRRRDEQNIRHQEESVST